MAMSPTITIDESERRIIATSGSSTASLEYRVRANRFIIMHTEVPTELSGQGLAGQLVTAAIAYADSNGHTVVPICPFARAWLRSHPDVAATVDIDWPPEPASGEVATKETS